MKPNEVRIGNWVNTIEGPVQIKAISQEGLMRTSKMLGDHLELAEPIPLTELWLEKFGFKSIGLNGQVFEHNKRMGDGNRFVIETDCITLYPKINFDSCCWSDFKYVHQLQNLFFALTGEELNIEL